MVLTVQKALTIYFISERAPMSPTDSLPEVFGAASSEPFIGFKFGLFCHKRKLDFVSGRCYKIWLLHKRSPYEAIAFPNTPPTHGQNRE